MKIVTIRSIEPGSAVDDRVRTRLAGGSVWTRWIAEQGNTEFASMPARPASRNSTSGGCADWDCRSRRALLNFVRPYVQSLLDLGKKVTAEDLQWSGLNRSQASSTLHSFMATLGAVAGPPSQLLRSVHLRNVRQRPLEDLRGGSCKEIRSQAPYNG